MPTRFVLAVRPASGLARPLLASLLLLHLGACADSAVNTGEADQGPRISRDAEVISMTDALPTTQPDAGRGQGRFMDACEDNRDCESGWCIEGADGMRQCTITCLDEGCPDGWACRVVQNTPPDVVSICLPPDGPPMDHRLCGLCEDNDDCPGGRCYQLGGDGICGLTCVNDDGCPGDYECRDVFGDERPSQCTPRSLNCSCEDRGDCPSDAGLPDMGTPDVGTPDAVVPDMMPPPDPDMAVPDMMPEPDMAVPDMMPPPDPDMMPPPEPDMEVPDMMPPPDPDMEIPDMEIPDMEIPDMEVPDMMPPPRLPYGSPCLAAAECESDICVNDPQVAGGICSQRCVRAADCPSDDVCLAAEGGVSVCFRNETGNACRVPGDCVEGICLSPPDPRVPWAAIQQICSSRCENDAKCPAGYRCDVVQTPQGPQRACSPEVRRVSQCAGGFRDFCLNSGTCVVPPGRQPLDINICINVPDALGRATDGYCSCTCASAADCPTGFACFPSVELSGDPTRPGICLAMSGYRCPAQAQGLNIDQCLSLTCIEDAANPNGSYCSSVCGRDVDCPAGYRCQQLGGSRACLEE